MSPAHLLDRQVLVLFCLAQLGVLAIGIVLGAFFVDYLHYRERRKSGQILTSRRTGPPA